MPNCSNRQEAERRAREATGHEGTEYFGTLCKVHHCDKTPCLICRRVADALQQADREAREECAAEFAEVAAQSERFRQALVAAQEKAG